MALGNVTVSANIAGLLTGQKLLGPVDITNAAAVAQTTVVVLAAGDNSISVPTGTLAAVIRLPLSNTANVTLKGVGGDTGIRINKTGTVVLNFDSAALPASIILNSSALQTAQTEILFM